LAAQLFEELSKKSIGNHNPIFAFMPDIISNLTKTPDLPEEHFKDIMGRLLRYMTKEKQVDALVTRCAGRVSSDTTFKTARGLIFCIQQLKVSLKGLACLDERVCHFKAFLLDDEFWAAIKVLLLYYTCSGKEWNH
jgi:GTPase